MTAGSGIPGEVIVGAEPVPLNADRPSRTLVVVNTGDRPIQVGSHYHLAAANPGLRFDRAAAWGQRLDIPAGTAVRFEPGVTREVSVVPLAGRRLVPGLRLGSPSGLDGGGGPSGVDGGGPSELDGGDSPSGVDGGGGPSEVDGGDSPSGVDGGGGPSEVDGGGPSGAEGSGGRFGPDGAGGR